MSLVEPHGLLRQRKRFDVCCLLLLAVSLLLLLQVSTISSQAAAPALQHAGSSRTRDLLQQQDSQTQQQRQQELLSALANDPQDDPFAGAHADASILGRIAAALPKTLQQHLQLLKRSMSHAVQQHTTSGHVHAAQLHRRRHHHRVVRHNVTHTWVHSPLLQMELPQPWDSINVTSIVRDNLEPDVSFWQSQLQRVVTVQDILDMAKNHPQVSTLPSTTRLVEIRGNRVRFPLMPPGPKQFFCDAECDPQMVGFVDAMHTAVQLYNMTLPDMLFILNTNDAPICSEEQALRESDGCRAPVISLSKESGVADLVGPVVKASDAQVHHRVLPWEQKLDKAFFRGVPSCGQMAFPQGCARTWVARMAQLNHSKDLDAGLVEEYNRPDQVAADPVLQDGQGPLPVLKRVPMTDLPKYRYLLNLDGHTAAYRLGHLLATNSLVLKQESPQVEYYYRSLRPYHHYVPILKQSEHDLIPRIDWARQHETQVHHIIKNANHFAMRYVTYPARVLYWKYVLLAYRSLVPDMDEYFKQSASTGSQMEVLLKSLAAKTPSSQANATAPGSLSDSSVQARLDAIAALAGEYAAVEEEQQLGTVLVGPGSGLEDAMQLLSGDEF